MRKLFLALLIVFLTSSFVLTESHAKRFGGGRSFGMQRNSSSFSRSNFNTNYQSSANSINRSPAQAPSGISKWLGPLTGLGIGALLGALLMNHGLGTGMLSWLAIAAFLFIAWGFIRARLQPQASQQHKMNFQTEPVYNTNNPDPVSPTQTSYLTEEPTGFNKESFLRQAKSSFIRLQMDYDTQNLADIRDFTTPEVYAEIQLQIEEMGSTVNQTQIISLNAELLDLTTEDQFQIATVLFSGSIKEELHSESTNINEWWHFKKELTKMTWLVAGIQQE